LAWEIQVKNTELDDTLYLMVKTVKTIVSGEDVHNKTNPLSLGFRLSITPRPGAPKIFGQEG